jgi:hypothetical protein
LEVACGENLFSCLLIFFGSTALWAYRGNASFDTSKNLAMKATVTEWVWANPHCWLKFDAVKGKRVLPIAID